MTPTPEDLTRDLHADLLLFTPDAAANWQQFIRVDRDPSKCQHLIELARVGWPAAVRRALATEAECVRLRDELAKAQAQVRAVVPLGDLSGVPAWMAERKFLQERIDDLEGLLHKFLVESGRLALLADTVEETLDV